MCRDEFKFKSELSAHIATHRDVAARRRDARRVRDVAGDVLDDALCDNAAIKASLDSIEITLRNLTIPAHAAIAGRRRDGKMFTVTHETRETLDELLVGLKGSIANL